MVNPGDVFAVQLPDGRFGAVRVLQTIGRSSLVCTSPYLGRERPDLSEPQIRKTVVKTRFLFKNEPARRWLEGQPPPNFEFLGNLPPAKAETKLECNVYGGKWGESEGQDAFLEWRWLHDRAAFEAEVRQQEAAFERRRQQPQKPKKMMSEEDFWSIIALLDWKQQGNDKKVLAPAVKALATKSKVAICQFEERLAFLLYQLDTKAHARHSTASGDLDSNYLSADGFLYARCVVVVNGKKFYESVLKNPRKMPKEMEFESLLSLARSAYEKKTGEELDYSTGCSYESFSNVAGWGE